MYESMKNSYVSCNRVQIFQLKELDSTDIFCIVGSDGELGSGASSVVRLSIHGAFGYAAFKMLQCSWRRSGQKKDCEKVCAMKVVKMF